MRLRDQLLEDGGVEHLAADRHPLPHVVEQLAIDRRPDAGVRVSQQRVRLSEQLVVRSEFVKAEVLDLDHAELFQVRIGVPPAASLVEPDAIGQHLAQHAFGFLEVEALQRRFRQPFGADLRVRSVEAQGALLGEAEGVAAQASRAGIPQCAEKTGTDQAHEEEVVEMTRLQSGVLAVVGEAQEFPREEIHLRVGAVHPA